MNLWYIPRQFSFVPPFSILSLKESPGPLQFIRGLFADDSVRVRVSSPYIRTARTHWSFYTGLNPYLIPEYCLARGTLQDLMSGVIIANCGSWPSNFFTSLSWDIFQPQQIAIELPRWLTSSIVSFPMRMQFHDSHHKRCNLITSCLYQQEISQTFSPQRVTVWCDPCELLYVVWHSATGGWTSGQLIQIFEY